MTQPTRSEFWERAGACYQGADLPVDAARCYAAAGGFRRAAELYDGAGLHREAAQMYVEAGRPELAGWILAHVVGDASAARFALTAPAHAPRRRSAPQLMELLRRLVEARCDLAEMGADLNRRAHADTVAAILDLLGDVAGYLAGSEPGYDPNLELWAVTIAELLHRFDHAALLFAASVRGWRGNAADRWSRWTMHRFGTAIVVPTPGPLVASGP